MKLNKNKLLDIEIIMDCKNGFLMGYGNDKIYRCFKLKYIGNIKCILVVIQNLFRRQKI